MLSDEHVELLKQDIDNFNSMYFPHVVFIEGPPYIDQALETLFKKIRPEKYEDFALINLIDAISLDKIYHIAISSIYGSDQPMAERIEFEYRVITEPLKPAKRKEGYRMKLHVGSTNLSISTLHTLSLDRGQKPKFIALGPYESRFANKVLSAAYFQYMLLTQVKIGQEEDLAIPYKYWILLLDENMNKLCLLHGDAMPGEYTLEFYEKPKPPQKLSIPLVIH